MKVSKEIHVVLLFVISFSTNLLGEIHSTVGKAEQFFTVEYFKNANQSLDMNCGPNCLWQILHCYKKDYLLTTIIDAAGTSASKGTTMQGMVNAALKFGLPAMAVKVDIRALIEDSRIAILLLNLKKSGHYVIFDSISDSDNRIRLLDGNKFIDLSIDELMEIWDGYAIMIGHENSSNFSKYHRVIGFSFILFGVVMLGRRLKMARIFIRLTSSTVSIFNLCVFAFF